MKEVGIVILNYRTYKDTIRLVSDINKFSCRNEIQIIVVDNNSLNESFDVLSDYSKNFDNVELVKSTENGGYAKGNNIGLKALAKYDVEYALILNNDIYLDEYTLKECIYRYKKIPDAGIVSPMQLLPNKKKAYVGTLRCNTFIDDILHYSIIYKKFRPQIKYSNNCNIPKTRKVDIIPGCFILTKYSIFKDIDFLDEDTFLFCEERFLFKKIELLGLSNYLFLDLGYIHDHSLTIKKEVKSIKQIEYFNQGQISFTRKYRKFPYIKSLIIKLAFNFYKIEVSFLRIIKNFLV